MGIAAVPASAVKESLTAESDLRVRAAARTDVGMVRERNEDAAYVDPRGRFFIVADGMGGHAAGDVASQLAVDVVRQRLEAARVYVERFAGMPPEQRQLLAMTVLECAVGAAHEEVCRRARREPDKHGMGTTLEVVLVTGSEAFVAHAGDSRTYLIRDGLATQITRDHTVAAVLASDGQMSPEQVRLSPMRSVLVNAVGVGGDVHVDLTYVPLRPGDRLLICTDGLYHYFAADELVAEMAWTDAGRAVESLVDGARDRGGHDNVTGVVVEVIDPRHGPALAAVTAEYDAISIEVDDGDDSDGVVRAITEDGEDSDDRAEFDLSDLGQVAAR